MKYITVNQMIDSADSVRAKLFLKGLWYAIEEDIFSLSLEYEVFNHQFMHLRASAPLNWSLHWDGAQFALSRQIKNHGVLSIIAQSNGSILYKFS